METEKNLRFSVIMCAYNLEKLVGAAIESVLKQKFDNYELIIVNDGSQDNTLNLLKKYQELGFDIENNGEHLEQIEKIIATTMKYLSSNPSGKLNNEKYNIQSQPTLLTDRILQNMPNNEPEVSISD